MTEIYYNLNDLQEMKRLYKLATEEGREIITYKGNEYLIRYLKYLIEYLETVLIVNNQ